MPSKPTVINIPYMPHAGQLECHKAKERFRVMANGRRWGKTLWLPTEIRQIMRDYVPILPRTELIRGWIVAPTYDHVQEDWRAALQLFGPLIIDRNIAEKWMHESVIYTFGPEFAAFIKKKLNDPEWAYLRTAPGRV